jgi:glycerophosphoryl diester phosphodiesterase
MNMSRTLMLAVITSAVAVGPLAAVLPASAHSADARVTLAGRAVLPAATLAPGPPAGANYVPPVPNGFTFPLPSQPVQGFSSIIDGRHPGEYLAMPDNGFGQKSNSDDFLIRAYYIRPHFKTAEGGSGSVSVGDYISFRDPDRRFGFPIVNKDNPGRLLTGADIDPESLQRDPHGDLWVGDEFGPWILHFSADGVLLDAPFPIPDVRSPNNPGLNGAPFTQPNSRGFEAMAITPDGSYLYAALEGAHVGDPDPNRRFVYEFSIQNKALTDRKWQYHTTEPGYMVADMAALDEHQFVLIERDGGKGLDAHFRELKVVDLRDVAPDGFLVSRTIVDLAAIPDPNHISLPAIHPGDVGLGNPFRVVCESVEAVHRVDDSTLLVGCDNNLPNSGRNPDLADDNEFILVHVAGLPAEPRQEQ